MLAQNAALGPLVIDRVRPEHIRAFAEVLDDPNPLHLDPEAVRAAGLGDRVMNQGPASFGYVLELLRAVAPGARVTRLDLKLQANVFAGDRVIAAGVIDAIDLGDGDQRLTCSVWLDIENGCRALVGTAEVAIPVPNQPTGATTNA
jgi:3-hydroxybutyryl-CoA dehydratase